MANQVLIACSRIMLCNINRISFDCRCAICVHVRSWGGNISRLSNLARTTNNNENNFCARKWKKPSMKYQKCDGPSVKSNDRSSQCIWWYGNFVARNRDSEVIAFVLYCVLSRRHAKFDSNAFRSHYINTQKRIKRLFLPECRRIC